MAKKKVKKFADGGTVPSVAAATGSPDNPLAQVGSGVGSVIGAPVGGMISGIAQNLPTVQTGFQANAPTSIFTPTTQQLGTNQRFSQALQGLQAQQPIQMQTGAADQARAQQEALVGQLQQTASGQGPSAATQFLRTQQDQNLANAMALAASARGGNVGLAQRQAAQQAASANQAAAGQAAQIRAQEALAAQGQLGGVLSGVRGQDIGLAAQQAQMGIQQRQFANQLAQQYQAMGLSADQAQLQAAMQAQQLQTGLAGQQMQGQMGAQEINSRMALANLQAQQMPYQMASQMVGGIAGGAAGALTGGILGGGGGGASAAAYPAMSSAAMGANVPMVSRGGRIGGQARVSGDSEKNDTVPAMLSPGEIVIPRSASGSPDKAKAFIDQLMASHGHGKEGERSYGEIVAEHQKLKGRLEEIERRLGAKKNG